MSFILPCLLFDDDNYSVFGYGYEHRRHSRRQSRSLMRGWHKTCFLAARMLHISFILPPASVVTLGLTTPVQILASECFLSAVLKDPSHSDHRQCSHAHTLPRSYNQAADMRSQIWPQHDVMARVTVCSYSIMCLVLWKAKSWKFKYEWYLWFLGKSFYELKLP